MKLCSMVCENPRTKTVTIVWMRKIRRETCGEQQHFVQTPTQWIRKMTTFLFEGDNASFEKEVEKLRNPLRPLRLKFLPQSAQRFTQSAQRKISGCRRAKVYTAARHRELFTRYWMSVVQRGKMSGYRRSITSCQNRKTGQLFRLGRVNRILARMFIVPNAACRYVQRAPLGEQHEGEQQTASWITSRNDCLN